MERYVCVHAHFYQPPRENPWLEAVEVQDSAHPYHDWNERITRECYAPNAAARLLDGEGRIAAIANNYSGISFNFGPTLLSWLQARAPEVYRSILDADRESQHRFSGHGSAIAQAYNHAILPLASGRDKLTQIVWGILDFERRFGRRPEGMWLPETAVDLETCGILAAQGLRFVILAPRQAHRVRRIGGRSWREVGAGIDTSRAYRLRIPGSDRGLAVFFYDGAVAQAVAFEGLLGSGDRFAERLAPRLSGHRDGPQLSHVATDGETYGHHYRHGDMALAYALAKIERDGLARLTNYGEFLERYPPTHEVEIAERTSWSCAHGVERWWRSCGCASGGAPGWDQEWRTPLREALDQLRDALAPRFEERAARLLKDPWRARNAYIEVVLDRSEERRDGFLAEHGVRPLSGEEATEAWKWLELQRHLMLMYTSCGWFFDDISGIETVQVIQYAGRAIQLARELLPDEDHETPFLAILRGARSNLPEQGDGAEIYARYVRPAMVDLPKVGAHYAITSLFDGEAESPRIYCYEVAREDHRRATAGAARLALGRARVTSEVTRESAVLSYAVLHLGDHNVAGAVRPFRGSEAYAATAAEIEAEFERGDLAAVLRSIDRHFDGATLSLAQLFRDEQRRITGEILRATLAATEASYRQVYERNAPLLRYLRQAGVPPPKALITAAESVVDAELRRLLAVAPLDAERIAALVEEARTWGLQLSADELGFLLERTAEVIAQRLAEAPEDVATLEELLEAIRFARSLPFPVDLWKVQNVYMALRDRYGADQAAAPWEEPFLSLGEALGIASAA